jgi:lysyl-tRNA synthetase, class II
MDSMVLKGREKQIVDERIKKIGLLRESGVNPYAHRFDKDSWCEGIQNKFKKLKEEEVSKKVVSCAGRIMTKRSMGKIAFGTLQDNTGRVQVLFQKEISGDGVMGLFKKVDAGDYIGVKGSVMRTKRGELSILVKELTILSKSIKPLPEKWHGIKDKEERYRKRYLDLIMNPEVMEVFLKREKILESVRDTLKKKNFHEVDTPYLQSVYGGAEARPFETHMNALDIDMFLAISPELYLKRLVVGGFERVYTIARNFRNEGIDRSHNPEFTMMEIYQAYADYNNMMDLTEELYENACISVNGSTKVKVGEIELDFKRPWAKMTMAEAIKKFAKIDVLKSSSEELKVIADKEGLEVNGNTWGYYVGALFEHFCEDKLIQPTFITDHPRESTPLCKSHRDGDERLIERFEPFCMGMELANAYSELNDPILQRQLLEGQNERLSSGEDDEAHPFDEDFVNSIETGLPPTGGLGIGIDRMVILLTGQESIRDVILFPFMKPEAVERKEGKEIEK